MFTRPWEQFFKEKLLHIFAHAHEMLDIGGSLRIDATRNNSSTRAICGLWRRYKSAVLAIKSSTMSTPIIPTLWEISKRSRCPTTRKRLLLCIAVLEHIENPFKATGELYRVLKPGGYCLVYVPFLYYYHAEQGYYGDYWRYTRDSLEHLFKPFSTIEIHNVRGAF